MPFDPTEPTLSKIEGAWSERHNTPANNNATPRHEAIRNALVAPGRHIPAPERAEAYREAVWALRGHR